MAKPEPTKRVAKPSESAPPPVVTPAAEVAKATPAARQTLPKEYVVRKGDSLGHIVENIYGTASARVVEFFVKANKEKIKNRNIVFEGQELSVPELPADMFEPVTNLNVARADTVKASVLDEAINRKAPLKVEPFKLEPVKPEASSDKIADTDTTKPPKVAAMDSPKAPKDIRPSETPAKETTRTYVAQPKDTFTSIAREQLGSESSWREIQKLNKSVDPTRLLPGTKLKLPAKRPLSEAASAERPS